MNLVDAVVLSDDDERICRFSESDHDPSLAEEGLAFQCTRDNVEALCENPEANIALWVIVKTHTSFGGHLDQGGLRSESNIDQRWYPEALSQRLAMVRALASRIIIHHMEAVNAYGNTVTRTTVHTLTHPTQVWEKISTARRT